MSDEPESSRRDRSRFEELAIPCLGALHGTAMRLTRRPEDAADLVQETFLRAYRTFANFIPGTNGKAWLFTVMYSIFVNRYRKKQNEPDVVSLDQVEERFHRSLAVSQIDVDPVISLQMERLGPEVSRALDRLPEEYRSAVLLVDVGELSYEEAAAALKCPVGTLRSRLSRARKGLFLELQAYARGLGYGKMTQT